MSEELVVLAERVRQDMELRFLISPHPPILIYCSQSWSKLTRLSEKVSGCDAVKLNLSFEGF
jgi:hypothetical protein